LPGIRERRFAFGRSRCSQLHSGCEPAAAAAMPIAPLGNGLWIESAAAGYGKSL
jgi:hypothetical protein